MSNLWIDCTTDIEKVEFLRSGKAVETGIIAPAIVEDVARAFEYRSYTAEPLPENSPFGVQPERGTDE